MDKMLSKKPIDDNRKKVEFLKSANDKCKKPLTSVDLNSVKEESPKKNMIHNGIDYSKCGKDLRQVALFYISIILIRWLTI